MLNAFLSTLCVLYVFIPRPSHSTLHSKFSHYEILTPSHITVRVKRDVSEIETYKELTLSIFGQEVSLSLAPGLPKSLVSPDAKFETVYANGWKSRIHVNHDDFHRGFIRGLPGSLVDSFFHEGLWNIQAIHSTFSFSIEPLSYYTEIDSHQKMVAYKHKDVRLSNETREFCSDSQHLNVVLPINKMNETVTHESWAWKLLRKRQTHKGKDARGSRKKRNSFGNVQVCDVLAIVDNRFLLGIASGSAFLATKILLHSYKIVGDIFSQSELLPNTVVTVQIRAIEIHMTAHSSNQREYLYSGEKEKGAQEILLKMIDEAYFTKYCVVHLHTQQNFKDKVLGLAITPEKGPPSINYGICAEGNVGLSSPQFENAVISLTSYPLVVAHEISHNFGARHDDEGKVPRECTPSQGGRYLMAPTANQGDNINNFKHSPCSKRAMSVVLKSRVNCLVPKDALDGASCGNGVVDRGEDCDAGFVLGLRDDCCTPTCRFSPDAVCSPFNHPCCHNCTVAPKTLPCKVNADNHSCLKEQFCDGVHSHSCPPVGARPNGDPCRNGGECWNGECIGYCQLLGLRKKPVQHMVPCTCFEGNTKGRRRKRETVAQALCGICCRNLDSSINLDCVESGKHYEDGESCEWGVCDKGHCKMVAAIDIPWNDTNVPFSYTDNRNGKIGLLMICLGILYYCCVAAFVIIRRRRSTALPVANMHFRNTHPPSNI